MRHKLFTLSFFASLISVIAADGPQTTTRVVEEKTITETRRVTETARHEEGQRKVAVFVLNRAGKALDDKAVVLEDLLVARVAGKGFTVLSRDIMLNALAHYAPAGTPNPPGESPGQQMDRLLSDSTSALRLAQSLGADFILLPTITSYGTANKTYEGNGVKTVNQVHTMRVGYKIAEGGEGGAVAGDTVAVSRTIRQSDGLTVDNGDLLNEMLDEAAGTLADSLATKQTTLAAPAAKPGQVDVTVTCSMTDIMQQPITVPDVQVKDGKAVVGKEKLEVQAMDVTVEVNGIVVGSAPGTFKMPAGLNKIRLSREGFNAWERTMNASKGQKLRVALQMSDEGYARWKDNLGFLQDLDSDRKLTDAEVKRIEGVAKFWSESHYRVDTKQNVTIYNKSLF